MSEDLTEASGLNIPLSEMIQTLRQELQVALSVGAGQSVTFGVGNVDLELSVILKKDAAANTGIKFWVLSADAKIGKNTEFVHRFKITLTPRGPDGSPLAVSSAHSDAPIAIASAHSDAPGHR